jgi:hypothetical protein
MQGGVNLAIEFPVETEVVQNAELLFAVGDHDDPFTIVKCVALHIMDSGHSVEIAGLPL